MMKRIAAVCALVVACVCAADTTLVGAGATFPQPLYKRWFENFQRRTPGASFDYRPIGSEAGVRELKAHNADFAASDMPLPDAALATMGLDVVQLPSVLGAVALVYNLENTPNDLHFTPEVLSKIFMGKITKWNDPAIQSLNRKANLPNRNIVVVHRADGSGTTYVLSDYLSKTDPEWKERMGVGTTLQWPVGRNAEGNDGCAKAVQATPNSIGYVEYLYGLQNRLSYAFIRNTAGKYVQADLESIEAAAKDAIVTPGDFRVSITNAQGPEAYPLAAFTYFVIPKKMANPEKAKAMREFLNWMLQSGQKQAAGLGYLAVPPEIAEKELAAVASIQ